MKMKKVLKKLKKAMEKLKKALKKGKKVLMKMKQVMKMLKKMMKKLKKAMEKLKKALDRKSTRLNSSHANISYAVFCLKTNALIRHPHHPVVGSKSTGSTPCAVGRASPRPGAWCFSPRAVRLCPVDSTC